MKHSVKSIVIVDDDEDILDALALFLEGEGYSVTTTPKGDGVLALVKEKQPKLLVLDLLLSGKDGRHICMALKADKATQHIPIVMISAHPSAGNSAKEAGADAFVAKPFDLNIFLETLARFV